MFTTLITATQLREATSALVVDCRFDLMQTTRGAQAYLEGHVPGALYAHLDHHLSGPAVSDHGRHPMPTPARLCEVFSALGITHERQVVCYDDLNGAMAARLWWLLRYMGQVRVAVLDGGWPAWLAAGGSVETGAVMPVPAVFTGHPYRERLVTLADLPTQQAALVDARDPGRFRGEVEPMDPRAGHIPGARNHCWKRNLASTGNFLPPAALREALRQSLSTLPDASTVHYCGSGVTACHNVLAQVHAGLPEPRLYGGSWSEWCADPDRPAALGEWLPEHLRK